MTVCGAHLRHVQTAKRTASCWFEGSRKATATLRPADISPDAMSRAVGMPAMYCWSEPVNCTVARYVPLSNALRMP
jgi:hypothetical protein